MRTREERVAKISEKMKSKKKGGYQGEKAQDFKNKYTEDVKAATKGRRARRAKKAREGNSDALNQEWRKNERRKSGMTREEQRAKYGNA